MLVDAARAAGAQVREDVAVDELLTTGGRVTGIRSRGGHTESARLVVGADGKHSLVARAVGAAVRRQRPASTFGCYGYWSGVEQSGGELYQRPDLAAAAFPTNDGLTMVFVSQPIGRFAAFRTDIEGNYLAALDRCADLGERVRAGERVERLRTTPDLPNAVRTPHGPGWALVGDAGLVMDPITAQGIGNAFQQADLLADAVCAGFDGGRLAARLAGYRRARDAALGPMYDFTLDLAALRPPRPVVERVLAALRDRPAEIERFFGVFAGITPVKRFLSIGNLLRVLGPRELVKVALRR
jgi:flavin-dependent dehydrogenase